MKYMAPAFRKGLYTSLLTLSILIILAAYEYSRRRVDRRLEKGVKGFQLEED
jgi:hypothetical protein